MLLAESGATKIAWCLVHHNSTIRFETSGIRAGHTSKSKIAEILREASSFFSPYPIESLHFYCSGCLSVERQSEMTEDLKPFFPNPIQINVYADLHAAAKATLGNSTGTCFILGTGSVMFEWDGQEVVELFGGKGFPEGDFAGGADLGQRLITYLSSSPDAVLVSQFENQYGKLDQLAEQISHSESIAKAFGQFAPFVIHNQTHDAISKLINEAVEEFLNDKPAKLEMKKLALVGSLAYHLKDRIIKQLHLTLPIDVIVEPQSMDGLITYHLNH